MSDPIETAEEELAQYCDNGQQYREMVAAKRDEFAGKRKINPLQVIGEYLICILIGVLVVVIFAIGTGTIFP
jgi:hypothetical protein